MGNYGIYIWPAYGLVLFGMAMLWICSMLQRHKVKQQLKLKLERTQVR